MKHTILTFITGVDPGKLELLKGVLDRIQSNVPNDPDLPFASLKHLHFASLVVFEDDEFGPCLVYENNFDGSLDTFLNELFQHARGALHEIYQCCLGYPAATSGDPDEMLKAYLRGHVVQPSAYHIGNTGRSAERSRREAELHDRIESFLDELIASEQAGVPAGMIREQIQEFVRTDPEWSWTAKDEPRQTMAEWLAPRAKAAAVVLGAVAVLRVGWRVVLPAAAAFAIALRWKEMTDRSQEAAADHEHVHRLALREDRIVQNHLASITRVKPGILRRETLRVVLWVANLLARFATQGQLSGIPSIHFAHWSLIDNGRRLLFLSNYDGSWENYLDDFIDKASAGLTGIWSNTEGFPPTLFLAWRGAKNGPRFKAWARMQQSYTNVWYSAYPRWTVSNIDNRSAIRERLFSRLNEAGVAEWLRRF